MIETKKNYFANCLLDKLPPRRGGEEWEGEVIRLNVEKLKNGPSAV